MLWKFWLGGVFSSVLCLFGFVGNLFAAVVLWGPKMSSAFNQVLSYPFLPKYKKITYYHFLQLLIALCVFDTLFLFCNVPFCLNTLGFATRECTQGRGFSRIRQIFNLFDFRVSILTGGGAF